MKSKKEGKEKVSARDRTHARSTKVEGKKNLGKEKGVPHMIEPGSTNTKG